MLLAVRLAHVLLPWYTPSAKEASEVKSLIMTPTITPHRYVDMTQNTTFLRNRAYPYLRLVADFYESYLQENPSTGRLDVLNSCAMEGCGSQDLPKGVASNNPPFDLGFVKTIFRKLVVYSALLGVDANRRVLWKSMQSRLAEYPTTTDPTTNKTVLNQQEWGPGGFPRVGDYGNARYPITFFAGIHPGEDISLGSDPTLVEAARNTVDAINELNWWSPTNGLCMAWPPAARVSNNASVTLDNFVAALNATLQPNLWPWIENRPTGGWGCPTEQAGATLAVNDLLMQSHEGFVRLFPAGWPEGESASFTTLRAEGAFLVSAGTTGGGVPTVPVSITSLVGGNCSVGLPRGWTTIVVERVAPDGTKVPVPASMTPAAPAGGANIPVVFTFATSGGGAYQLST